MPRIADYQQSFPSGAYTDADTVIDMDGLDFIVALAADGEQIDKTQSDAKLSSYSDKKFSVRVDEAYEKGKYLYPLMRLHFGSGFEYDIENPKENKQLNRVCYQTDNLIPRQSYHGIIVQFDTTDTDGNTAVALAHHIEQIRSRSGNVKTFLRITKEQWETFKAYDNLISPVKADYPLCIPDSAADGIIETPGDFYTGKGLIWERNGLYCFWGTNMADFLDCVPVNAGSVTPEPEPEPELPPEGGEEEIPEGDAALVAEIHGLREDLRTVIKKLAEALQDISDELGEI